MEFFATNRCYDRGHRAGGGSRHRVDSRRHGDSRRYGQSRRRI